jgi:hypothetical protein
MAHVGATLTALLIGLGATTHASAFTLGFATLGPDYTSFGNNTPLRVDAPGGERITFTAADSQFQLFTQGTSLYGSQFADGTRVLSPGLTDSPVMLSFSKPLDSLSLSASSLRFGAFTATVSLFDGTMSLGSTTIASDVEGPGENGPLPTFDLSGFGASGERITSAIISVDQPSNFFGGSVLLGPVSYTLSTIPLPSSAPMFGAALLGLAGFGYAARRKKAAAAA